MPSSCIDPSDLVIPAFDSYAKTLHLTIDIHPGQARMLDHFASCDWLPFRERDALVRWCICWGVYTLLGPLPSTFALIEAKMNVLQDERFERQKDCAADSVQKWLAAGNIEAARKLVMLSYEEYRRIPTEYWRTRWLSTLEPAVDLLRQCGVNLKLG